MRFPSPRRRRTRPDPAGRRAAVLAYPLLGMGVLHFAVPQPFDAIVPSWIPGSARFWTYASGVAELAVGGAVATPSTRRLGATAAIGLFLAVFPANVQMAWDWRRKPWPYAVGAVGRLPLQYPMITHALRVRSEA
ncbi:hypothetical protein LQ327_13625 [Actinomycetospora endophytica]|uniref:DoxX-like protein n=1 Tax=Actinomycetospora endophytica TaxID=2291215 RepID=A0ABS8P8T2_9PSEU|nr:hypothetical protein [Actinomycetospora endophytica]MCD2194413.1 hypothetical protein [Actinomycetospora endophytica]